MLCYCAGRYFATGPVFGACLIIDDDDDVWWLWRRIKPNLLLLLFDYFCWLLLLDVHYCECEPY